MIEREEEEWALADRIVCGSGFVADSIGAVGGPHEKTTTVEYPVPVAPPIARKRTHDGTLRVLFAGTLQLRKGIQYLCEATERLAGEPIEFRAVGPSQLTPWAENRLRGCIDWRGQLLRSEMWAQYEWADVFVLPTLSEGSANACLEASACGLPVITSPASGLAAGGERSIVCDPRDADAIAARVKSLASERHTGTIPGAKKRSIDEYGRNLAGAFADAPCRVEVRQFQG